MHNKTRPEGEEQIEIPMHNKTRQEGEEQIEIPMHNKTRQEGEEQIETYVVSNKCSKCSNGYKRHSCCEKTYCVKCKNYIWVCNAIEINCTYCNKIAVYYCSSCIGFYIFKKSLCRNKRCRIKFRIYFAISIYEKDKAKEIGAKWDGVTELWYAPHPKIAKKLLKYWRIVGKLTDEAISELMSNPKLVM
jgi:hypothetical protein